jgi:hypothetical protein
MRAESCQACTAALSRPIPHQLAAPIKGFPLMPFVYAIAASCPRWWAAATTPVLLPLWLLWTPFSLPPLFPLQVPEHHPIPGILPEPQELHLHRWSAAMLLPRMGRTRPGCTVTQWLCRAGQDTVCMGHTLEFRPVGRFKYRKSFSILSRSKFNFKNSHLFVQSSKIHNFLTYPLKLFNKT